MAPHPPDTLSQTLLAAMPESHVLVLPDCIGLDGDPLVAVWKAARDEAARAYEAWRGGASSDAFAVWRAAADREDAAADTLASRALERRGSWSRLLKGNRRR
jgi:hypothetical protein